MTRYYLSLDAVKSAADPLLTGSRAVPGVAAGASHFGTVTVTIPPATAPRYTDIKVSACPHPFEQRRVDYLAPAGLTIAEIIELIQPDPLLRAHGRVFIGEHLILRENWHRVRPAPGVQLTIRLLPSSGGGLRIGLMIGIAVLAIAAMVAAP